MAHFTIAGVQLASTSAHPDPRQRKLENLARLEAYVDLVAAVNPQVDLLLFPELCVPGVDLVGFRDLAEPIPGEVSERLAAKARQVGKWLVPGTLLELGEGGQVFNTALLLSPAGEIALTYRKTCVPRPLEPSALGAAFPVYEIPGVGTVGLMICSDGHFPEVARALALQGAEVILKPTLQPHWIGGPRNHDDFAVVRAVENQVYLVSVNQPSPLGMGHSLAVDPEGRTLERLGDAEALFTVAVDFGEVRRVREYGSFGMFPFLKMLRDFVAAGVPLEAAYRQGVGTAPVYRSFEHPAPQTPAEIRRCPR